MFNTWKKLFVSVRVDMCLLIVAVVMCYDCRTTRFFLYDAVIYCVLAVYFCSTYLCDLGHLVCTDIRRSLLPYSIIYWEDRADSVLISA